MNRTVLLFVCLLPAAVCAQAQHSIDTVLTSRVALAGEDGEYKLILRCSADSIRAPFRWSVTVLTPGHDTVYSRTTDDALIDRFFAKPGFGLQCSGYEACKRKYYFEELPRQWYQKKRFETEAAVFDRSSSGSIHAVMGKYLEGRNISQDRIRELIALMCDRMRTSEVLVLTIPISPVQQRFPLVYVRELNMFVPFYEW